ncbi:hypothetical protein ACQPZX_29395 [Actinoplanes sp. CA-142083]|uniref:hypothetical protein n=1 Tax=Actinoplanes sp. CA-142083 TaxID=3239903 RepID=UPI003D914B3F
MSEAPKPPTGLRAGGQRLWDSITGEFELDEHELSLAREVCRTVDQVDELESIVRRDGAIIESPQGLKTHPAMVEARQQRIALARLLAALRMPAGDEGDKVQGRREHRPQRRSGVRGVYGIKGGKAS